MHRKNKVTCFRIEKSIFIYMTCMLIRLFIANTAYAHEGGLKTVLFLNSYHPTNGWTAMMLDGVEHKLKQYKGSLRFDVEYLDLRYLNDATHRNNIYNLLKTKAGSRKYDVIITAEEPAFLFVMEHRNELYPNVPVVFCGFSFKTEHLIRGHTFITGVIATETTTETIEIALKLHPKARQVVILMDKLHLSDLEETLAEFSRKFGHRARFLSHSLLDPTPEELVRQIEGYSEETVILFRSTFTTSGKLYPLKGVGDMIRQRCSAPIYVQTERWFGYAPVMGGKFNSGFHQGLKAAEMAISILDGESVENIPIVKDDFIEYKFDYNQLKRYGIPFSKLPKGSIFINEPKSFFHLYKRRILAVCGIITGLLATIAILTMNIIRRRIIERELVQYQQRLKSLTSKLSLSEERERRRISNELYRSIGRSLVESKDKIRALCKLPLSSDIIDGLKEVSESLEQTIKNIKSLTFDLGTPILYESGLEAAISEWLLEQIEHKYGISTKFEGDGEPKPLDDDVRALVFRNVQELVINVVKHAQASRVRVYSQKIDNRIQIRIEDNGVGFNADEITSRPSRNGGFGLFNIRERLEQVGGRLAIESETGQGTRATITAPLNEGSSAK